jgi:trehalose 6-phosphate phosphatase
MHDIIPLKAFSALDPATIALLLDVDGTLIDIAPSPDAVVVPEVLRATLARLAQRTGGALALVSGRTIHDLDRLFAPLKLPVVGGHGVEMRLPGRSIVHAGTQLPDDLHDALEKAGEFDPGIICEDKGYSIALHYRKAPEQQERLRRYIETVVDRLPGEFEVLPGKAVFEVKRADVSKGEAVRALMTQPPFKGRTPVFIGDDDTDKSVFALLPALGGLGFSVDLAFEGLAGVFASPDEVRQALQRLAGC